MLNAARVLLIGCLLVAGAAAPVPAGEPAQKAKLGPWYVIGPFAVQSGEGFATAFPPERETDMAKSYGGQKWVQRPELVDGVVQVLKEGVTGPTYLCRTITAPAPTTLTAYFGSDDGLVVWLNGKQLISKDVPRGAEANQDTAKLDLRQGANTLLLKIYNISGGHGYYFSTAPAAGAQASLPAVTGCNFGSVRRAINDLAETYGARYPKAREYLSRLDALEKAAPPGDPAQTEKQLAALAREALLANPLLDFQQVLLVKRGNKKLGLPQNWQGNSTIGPRGYDNEIALVSMKDPEGALKTFYRPQGDEFVGDLELHWDADRLLFSKPGTQGRFQVWEIRTDGSGLRQVTAGDQPDVDNYDACYLPDGRIIVCSTACYLGVPCVSGGDHVGSLYIMDNEGKGVRQLTFDQDHSWCPTVLPTGRVLYTRWEYSDTPHYFTRILFEMNPDGTAQFEHYGSNSYWPNSIFYARPVPGHPTKLAAVISGHHGVPRMGELVVLDPSQGRHEASGVVQRIPGYGQKVEPIIRDNLVDNSWPKFLHPYPLSEKYFLVSCKMTAASEWGLYLVDVFDNLLLLHQEPGYAMFEPTPLRKAPRPPAIPDKVKPAEKTATVYLVDVYQGGGLRGVPRGTVKRLRVYTHHYAYRGMGGHSHIGIDGPWDAKRILGTVPVYDDGSAMFRVPANMPIVVQPLDAEGRAVQVMRSWYTAMPGEFAACVGCHEPQSSGPPPARLTAASKAGIVDIEPWRGPARPFGFVREVQPVLDKFCVSCHNGQAQPDGKTLANFKADQPNAAREVVGEGNGFTASYVALHPYVRRPGPESDYHLPVPCEWHTNTSELVQMLKKGHSGVKLDAEAWDRLYTWIDLNVPDHGTWSEFRRIAGAGQQRRVELSRQYANLDFDPEVYPAMAMQPVVPVRPEPVTAAVAPPPACPNWPLSAEEARNLQLGQVRQVSAPPAQPAKPEFSVEVADGVKLDLVLIPAGEFIMGDARGQPDEQPQTRIRVDRPFWMGKVEVTNEQYAAFDPLHDSRYISVFNKDQSNPGEIANRPRQPVIRVSWQEAMGFCAWLSQKTGRKFALPTEAQWEYACRAGTATPLNFGACEADFGKSANLADERVNNLCRGNSPRWIPAVKAFNDGAIVTEQVGKYQPNAWGLCDMHGNVWEWTRTTYKPYPYDALDGRDAGTAEGDKVVRSGSFYDRPQRARSAFRLSYPWWQRVFNVGFRVMCQDEPRSLAAAVPPGPAK
ncbi:MAG: SUMF1/EgtB/PvdO family nonheme iron enzyme [Planctomycetota bacterium]|nr:SUMF1/EgtB/PvdO family nonheme iron enzyme [Planctomycetota bacterium]